MSLFNISFIWPFNPLAEVAISIPGEWSKKIDQQGRDLLIASRRGQQLFGAWSVFPVHEQDNMTRTPLAAFFKISKFKQILKGTV